MSTGTTGPHPATPAPLVGAAALVPLSWMHCDKCGHLAYHHEDPDLHLVKCHYWGCRCRRWKFTHKVGHHLTLEPDDTVWCEECGGVIDSIDH